MNNLKMLIYLKDISSELAENLNYLNEKTKVVTLVPTSINWYQVVSNTWYQLVPIGTSWYQDYNFNKIIV